MPWLESSRNARPPADSGIRTTRRKGKVYLTQACVVNMRIPIVHIQRRNVRTFQIIREGIEKPTCRRVHRIKLMEVNRIDMNHQAIRSHWGKRPRRQRPKWLLIPFSSCHQIKWRGIRPSHIIQIEHHVTRSDIIHRDSDTTQVRRRLSISRPNNLRGWKHAYSRSRRRPRITQSIRNTGSKRASRIV